MPSVAVGVPEILGRSVPLQQARQLVGRYGPISDPVLVLGPTGSGKGLVAKALHAASGCRGRFVHLSGGHLVDTLYHSQLFGHTRGAYTGATRDAPGAFEQAQGGTLFLDELPLWSRAAQGAVLQAIEEGWVLPLGAQRDLLVTSRVVLGTNQRLEQLVASGRLMEDLVYRIGAFVIELPPLAERRVDIAVMAYHYLDQEIARDPTHAPVLISVEALDRLLAYDWPGNVRQVKSAIRFACVQAQGEERILRRHLPTDVQNCPLLSDDRPLREVTSWLYEAYGRDRRKTARRLGVHPNTVDYRLRQCAG